MTNTVVNINYNKELILLINEIKDIGLSNQGIIFGGLVRDTIISTHFRKQFNNKKIEFNKYWDNKYDIETSKRILIPNDMDIYFKNEINSKKFINKINQFVSNFNGKVIINNINKSASIYINNNLSLNHTKLSIQLYIGKTIRFKGVKLTFNIDLLFNNNINNNTIEPPFYNLDFLCNVFIMEKINGRTSIRLSNCTGTPIDSMNYINKAKTTIDIMTDITNLTTSFTRNINNFKTEFINCYRILKMIDKPNYYWNIINIPFKISNKLENKDEICYICLEEIENINNDNKIVEINTNKNKSNIIHYNCFITYLKQEQVNKYINPETKLIECRCPFRNPFNFKECYKSVKYNNI